MVWGFRRGKIHTPTYPLVKFWGRRASDQECPINAACHRQNGGRCEIRHLGTPTASWKFGVHVEYFRGGASRACRGVGPSQCVPWLWKSGNASLNWYAEEVREPGYRRRRILFCFFLSLSLSFFLSPFFRILYFNMITQRISQASWPEIVSNQSIEPVSN